MKMLRLITAINVAGLVALASAAPAQETGDRAKQAVSSALGVKETTYSDGWERDDPITIASFEDGECCCPGLRRLPSGDLVVGVGRGGDIHFANNAGDHAAWFRSRDNGRTWAPDREFRPPYEKLFIRGDVVRCYDQYSFAIKGRSPSRYICRYAESTDGGRTFSKRGISTYDTLGHPEGDSPYRAGQLAGGMHGKPNPGPWREILDEAGWKGDDWVNAPVGGITSDGIDHHGWLEMPDGSLLTCHSSAKRADWRSGNTLVSRSTDGGISWQFVSRVNPEKYERVEGYNEASPMLHRDVNHKDSRLTVIMRCGGGGFPARAGPFDRRRPHLDPARGPASAQPLRAAQPDPPAGRRAGGRARPPRHVRLLRPGRRQPPLGVQRQARPLGPRNAHPEDAGQADHRTEGPSEIHGHDLGPHPRGSLVARPELVDGYMSGWENLAIEELPNGELLIVYDVQNWIEKPGAPPRKAIRAVRMRRKEAKKSEAAARTDAAPNAGQDRRTRRVLYNFDGASCMFTKAGGKGPVPITVDDVKRLIEEVAYDESHVDTVLVCINAQVMYYPTKIGTMIGTPPAPAGEDAGSQQFLANLKAFYDAGVDPYAVMLAETKRRGREALLSFRMNDDHGMVEQTTQFWVDHPECRLGGRALDFGCDKVRTYIFRLIEEAVRRYDCDGLELDFNRFPTFFKAGATEERVAKMNSLVERVRGMLDDVGRERGRRLILSVRVPSNFGRTPPTPETARQIGCDVPAWAKNGWVDFVTVSEFLFERGDLPVGEWKRAVTTVPVYGGIEVVWHNKPEGAGPVGGGLSPAGAQALRSWGTWCLHLQYVHLPGVGALERAAVRGASRLGPMRTSASVARRAPAGAAGATGQHFVARRAPACNWSARRASERAPPGPGGPLWRTR